MEETLKLILEEMSYLKNGISSIKNDVSELKNDVSELKNDVSELKNGQDRIEVKLDNVSSEIRSNFNFTNDKIADHKKVFEVVSNEIKGVKIDIDFLSSKTGRHDVEINNILNKIKG